MADKLAKEGLDKCIDYNGSTNDWIGFTLNAAKKESKNKAYDIKLVNFNKFNKNYCLKILEKERDDEKQQDLIINKKISNFSFWFRNREFENIRIFKKEMKLLNKDEFGIIWRLRSGHCRLNWYKNCRIDNNINGNCNYCNSKETVKHFLLDCNHWNEKRDDLLNNVENIYLSNDRHWDWTDKLTELLLPPKLQLQDRIIILKEVVLFVKNTKWI